MTYSSSLAVSRQRFNQRAERASSGFSAKPWGKNQNAVSFRSQGAKLGPISNTIILVILACLLGLLYLTQVTKTNAYGYKISDLKQQASQLQQEHDQLEVASARLQALDRVKNSDVAKNLVSVSASATVQN